MHTTQMMSELEAKDTSLGLDLCILSVYYYYY